MSDKTFFKPTSLYKEYMILDIIEKNSHITQRVMSSHVGISLAMINLFLDEFEYSGLIKRHKHTSKTVEYVLTKKGIERRKLLNIWYLKSSLDVYISAKNNIIIFLHAIINKGYKKILLYGAGEVAEIMIRVMNDDKSLPLEVVALVDDNKDKEYKSLLNKLIISIKDINQYVFDGILISSYKNYALIFQKLINNGYDSSKIINFFE